MDSIPNPQHMIHNTEADLDLLGCDHAIILKNESLLFSLSLSSQVSSLATMMYHFPLLWQFSFLEHLHWNTKIDYIPKIYQISKHWKNSSNSIAIPKIC
jgi:hypothetical protein